MISFDNVSLSMGGGRKPVVEILRDISFGIGEGDLFAILGPSGAGKSSLLRLANRLQDPTSGRVKLRGEDIAGLDVIELRRRCAMVFQQPTPLPGTVEDNLLAGPALRGNDLERYRERVGELLEHVRLDAKLRSRPATDLSVGQQHRVALARALMNEPEVLMLDEPTAALDPGTSSAVLEMVADLNRKLGLTVVMVTHDFREARRVARGVAVIIDGRLRATGGAEVLSNPGDAEVERFLREEG